jgi:hypothetical protein
MATVHRAPCRQQGDGHGHLVLVAERDIMTEPIATAPAVRITCIHREQRQLFNSRSI